jgi:hypothetical protein
MTICLAVVLFLLLMLFPDGTVPGFLAATPHSVVSRPQSGPPALLLNSVLHRLGEGTVEAVDRYDLLRAD